jgi:hypothetical protein
VAGVHYKECATYIIVVQTSLSGFDVTTILEHGHMGIIKTIVKNEAVHMYFRFVPVIDMEYPMKGQDVPLPWYVFFFSMQPP